MTICVSNYPNMAIIYAFTLKQLTPAYSKIKKDHPDYRIAVRRNAGGLWQMTITKGMPRKLLLISL